MQGPPGTVSALPWGCPNSVLSPQCRSGNHLCAQLADHLVRARFVRLQARRAIIRLLPGLPPPDAHLFCCCGRCWLEGRGWVNRTTAGCWGAAEGKTTTLLCPVPAGQSIPLEEGQVFQTGVKFFFSSGSEACAGG